MNDNKQHRDDEALEALFDAGRKAPPSPERDFLARLGEDAERALPQPSAPGPSADPDPWSGLKGLFAASGLALAAAVGVWIGVVMPETLDGYILGSDPGDVTALNAFLPGADLTALIE